MKKYLACFIAVIALSGCAMITKQYYYVPSVPHQTLKHRFARSDFKMVYNKFRLSGKTGDSIGSVTVSNGIGHPLMVGPLIFPVIPVGGFFQKIDSRFLLELTVDCKEGYFMSIAIDSNDYKRIQDSLYVKKLATRRELKGSQCYIIVNDSLKVPLHTSEFFMRHTNNHSYWMTSDIKFRSVKTMRLVTGNALLDSTLKQVTFKRRSRIKFDLVGPGY